MGEVPTWVESIGSLLGIAVTAVATVLLWLVTRTLAKETRRLADLSSRPHIVATLEPNQWIMFHADLKVDNTGNGTAYDVQVNFAPPLPGRRPELEAPLQRISVLKPGQGLSSHLVEFEKLFGTNYVVTTSWCRDPSNPERESNTYELDLSALKGMSQLGASGPAMQIAQQVKHIREDWKSIASAFKHLKVDIYTSIDRLHERRQLDRRWRSEARNQQRAVEPPPEPNPEGGDQTSAPRKNSRRPKPKKGEQEKK